MIRPTPPLKMRQHFRPVLLLPPLPHIVRPVSVHAAAPNTLPAPPAAGEGRVADVLVILPQACLRFVDLVCSWVWDTAGGGTRTGCVAGVAWVEFLGYWEVGLLILQCSR